MGARRVAAGDSDGRQYSASIGENPESVALPVPEIRAREVECSSFREFFSKIFGFSGLIWPVA